MFKKYTTEQLDKLLRYWLMPLTIGFIIAFFVLLALKRPESEMLIAAVPLLVLLVLVRILRYQMSRKQAEDEF
jgi:L-asparagine transporter-like permease